MTIHDQKEAGYITLKEASERFGYAPDYIGQLIRKGKIEGKQVYANVAWMTTAEAIEEYMANEKRSGRPEKAEQKISSFFRLSTFLFAEENVRYVHNFLRGVLLLLILALIILFYFISIAIDHHLIQNAEKDLAARTRIIADSELAPLAVSQMSHDK